MTRKFKYYLTSLLIIGWLFIFGPNVANADESTVQVGEQTNSSVGSIQLNDTATAVIQNPVQVIQSAQSAITQAESSTAIIEVQSASITTVTETITATISQAQESIIQAKTAVDSATAAVSQLDSATVLVSDAEEIVSIAQIAVDSQTAVVADKTQVVESATAVVNANTTPGLNLTIYSNPGTAASPSMGGTVVYTGRDNNGINEQWGSLGPVVNGGTTTTTETFAGNILNTNIGISVNGTLVSTNNNNGVYIGSIGFPGPGQDPSLSLYQPSATTLITMPAGTTSAGFEVFAKNGNTTGLITYSDGTTETYLLQHNVSSEYANYVHRETFTAPAGKTIASVTIPTDWDYFAIDNVSATQQLATVVADDFQVKWQGLWTPQYTGIQYITASADDGVRLYLDNELIIDDWFDKGGGGSTADVMTTAGIAKKIEMWYYENGGGAAVSLLRYSDSLGWGVIPGTEFSTSSATTEQIQTLQAAQNNLAIAQATLDLLDEDLETAESDLEEAEQNLLDAQNNLNEAIEAVGAAITSMNTNVIAAQHIVVQTLAAEEAERARIAEEARLAEIARQAAIAAEAARVAAQQAYEAEQARIKAEAEAKAAAELAAKLEAERIAAEESAKKAEAERIAAEKAAAEKLAAEEKAKAEAEAKAKAEAEAKAKAELEAKLKAEEEAKKLAEQKSKAEAEAKKEAEKLAKEEAEKKAEEERLSKIAEEAKNGKELSEKEKEMVVESLVENLKPGESISAAEIKSSGVSFADLPTTTPIELRTDENGNALVITAAVAANIELVQDPGALLSTALTNPGAALEALGSIGADMTEAEREEATDMVVATVVAAGAAINAAAVATGGATGGSTGGGGSSGGGSGANSPGSRGGRRW